MKYSAVLAAAAALTLGLAENAQTNNEPSGQNKALKAAPPKTVGAMDKKVGNKATSPEDVKRQTEGKPTMQQEALKGKSQTSGTNPSAQYSPGTFGAAPGSEQPNPKK
jgi:hypothetical protein